jgi:DNA invertase Pin-like site-specific DNA recombinase
MPSEQKLFVSYLRVSTVRQGLSGLGLEAQRDAVERFLRQSNGRAVAELTEIESGRKSDRPKLIEALRLCRIHSATLVIAKLDRLARNVAFISNLMESKIEFTAVDFPSANRLTIHILAAVAEHEAQMIRERTKAALAAARARGVRLGGNRGNLPEVSRTGALASAKARHANTLRVASDLKPILNDLAGRGLSIRGIGRELDAMGIRPSRGGCWGPSQVHRIIRMAATQ